MKTIIAAITAALIAAGGGALMVIGDLAPAHAPAHTTALMFYDGGHR